MAEEQKARHPELALYEQGLTETQIAEKVGTVRSTVQSRLKKYRAAKVLTGSHGRGEPVQVDWLRAEQVQFLKSSQRKVPALRTQKASQEPPGRANPAPRDSLTVEEIEKLRAFLANLERRTTQSQRSHESGVSSVRVDTGLWDALKAWADKTHVTVSEALNQAIEALLDRRS